MPDALEFRPATRADAEEQAMDAGKPTVRLYTHVTMTENVAFYTRRGFVETHREPDGFRRIFMSKSLAVDASAQ